MTHSQRIVPLVLVAGLTIGAHPVGAQAEFGPPEAIDTDVSPVTYNTSAATAFDGTDWHLIYEKSGLVHLASRNEGVWSSQPVATVSSSQRNAKLARSGDALVALWEDDRNGHTEVFARRISVDVWGPETCMSCDEVPSRSPGLGSLGGGLFEPPDEVMAVWVDDTSPSLVRSRTFTDGDWASVVDVSSSTYFVADAPSVLGISFEPLYFVVVWEDRDPPFTQITYRRSTDETGSEFVLGEGVIGWSSSTDLGLSLGVTYCCKGFEQFLSVGWQEDSSFFYNIYDSWPGSPADVRTFGSAPGSFGVASATSAYQDDGCYNVFNGGQLPSFNSVHVQPNGDRVYAEGSMWTTPAEINLGSGEGSVWMNSTRPKFDGAGRGDVLVAFVRDVEGVNTLTAFVGHTHSGKFGVFSEEPGALLITPGASPTNLFRLMDQFRDEPISGMVLGLQVDAAVRSAVTFVDDPDDILVETDSDGYVELAIEGGGCAEGFTKFTCDFWQPASYFLGVKSPDVDGNCAVDEGDLAYVQSQFGTSDYCADLDGSGVVDADDEAIVALTLGDICSTTSVDAPVAAVFRQVRVAPNPVRSLALVRVEWDRAEAADVRIVDVQGRVVRTLDSRALVRGINHFKWERTTDAGLRAAPGRYFAVVVPKAGERVAVPILVAP